MPKTHMGWAKRTIEKETEQMKQQKREEAQRQLQQQLQQAVGQIGGVSHQLQAMGMRAPVLAGAGRRGGDYSSAPSGPNLPRNRLDNELYLGEVLEWKGKFGWINPVEPIDHPLARSM
mmetsp:Transcript_104559/g.207619  ORF Transcript_104559/g.207619 Transcript_104559/m.207619 type:complete len:118 (-) Transcript_104559:14-367(-)